MLCPRLPCERQSADLFRTFFFFYCEKLALRDKEFLLLPGTLEIYKEVLHGGTAPLPFCFQSCFLTQKVMRTLLSPCKIYVSRGTSNGVKSI